MTADLGADAFAKQVVFVPFDQLNRRRGGLREADPRTHEVLMIESDELLGSRAWHAQRVFFIMSAAAHFREELEAEGFTVHLLRSPTVMDGVAQFRTEHPDQPIIAAQGSSHAQQRLLDSAGIEIVSNDFFLTSRDEFARWASGRATLVMETFYRWQRTRLGILLDDDGAPVGGQWNFDADNRLPPPKGHHPWPPTLEHPADAIDEQVWSLLKERDLPLVGSEPDGTWATTRAGALRQLEHFLETGFADFGPYEDAMPSDSWSVNHSLLSPYLNIGLLHPSEVIEAVIARFGRGDIPISSCEGFIRQLIGWREYINGVYWHFGDEYRNLNGLTADRPLLPLFEASSRTQMNCVATTVRDLEARAWAHHIPRLMVLANLALITGVEPAAFLDWMRRMFIDAADWVMVPNVIGMGVHADGGQMMTKPYAAGGAYISRMGNYCSGCAFNPKLRTGPTACPFTTLYWDFLDRNRSAFERNHRMAQQVRGLDRLSDLPELRVRAQEVLAGLSDGVI